MFNGRKPSISSEFGGSNLELEHSDGEHYVKICQDCNYSTIHIISLPVSCL